MILGLLLRNFKIYKSITYIPISNGEKFCGLIGKNGVGKSSILESLDFYFNNKPFKVNIINQSAPDDECYVVPIFAIDKKLITDKEMSELAESFSNKIWTILSGEINNSFINNNYVELFRLISSHVKGLNDGITNETHYILPLGSTYYDKMSLGIFRDNIFIDSVVESLSEIDEKLPAKVVRATSKLSPLRDKVRNCFQYVYIPKDIETDRLVQFERLEIQTLLGTRLEEQVSEFLPKSNIIEISKGLKDFIESISENLQNYKFKVPSTNQPNLKPDKIYSLIIQEFFSLRELHKEGAGGKDIALKHLSSGEKQQAVLSLIHSLISEYRDDNTSTLIIAVDEPESSLHIAACYDQFEKLKNVSDNCCQTLFSSHWYGFIPAMTNGSVTNIVNIIDSQNGFIFNIHKYREEIKHKGKEYGKMNQSTLPIDIMLKSSNDFIQSVLMSVIGEESYNWLICEGSSDKIYLDEYLKDEIVTKKLRIIPVCTATEVKNTYYRLSVLFEELEGKINGKVFFLIDTDASPIEFETKDGLEKNLLCRRIVNDKNTTNLVKISSSPKAPITDIEDTLNGAVFNKTLFWFKEQGNTILNFVENEKKEEIASFFAMNLRLSESGDLDIFFNDNKGNNKVLFAQKYVELMKQEDVIPSWIQEIKNYFNK